MSVDYDKQEAEIQKLSKSQLRPKRYQVKLSEIYFASPPPTYRHQEEDDAIDNGIPLGKASEENESLENESLPEENLPLLRRSERIRNQPNWLSTSEIERLSKT